MPTKIVGILNITPDSFSDGGRFIEITPALEQLRLMLFAGADIIDIGAESTRPSFTPVQPEEEWRRLEKIFPAIVETIKKFNHDQNKKIEISLDTRHAKVAKHAHEIGIDILNDVGGLIDNEMIEFIVRNNLKTILMHSLPVPVNPEIVVNQALNVTGEILKWAREKILFLERKSVKKSQLIFDPGIGFGKNVLQSLRILKNIDAFRALELPIYVGHSKKSCLDALEISGLKNNKESRAEKTLVISNYLAQKGVEFLRVHDVAGNKNVVEALSL